MLHSMIDFVQIKNLRVKLTVAPLKVGIMLIVLWIVNGC